jgi:hypothetical protein
MMALESWSFSEYGAPKLEHVFALSGFDVPYLVQYTNF